jgi:glucose-1-phosphate adenylyltransferase
MRLAKLRHRSAPRIVALVLAGGQGARLRPLTDTRSKPAVPFGARYRIVDFVLSNLVNSGISTIYLLVQYKSQSLIEHIRKAWTISPLFPECFVTVVPPQMQEGPNWFQGTADAVCQNLNLVLSHHSDMVLIFGADHVYRMDVGQMIDFHLQRAASVTIAAVPVPLERASDFGIVDVDAGGRVNSFAEKPERPRPMSQDPTRAFASMGNYLFNTCDLLHTLREGRRQRETDFGCEVLPRLLEDHRVFAYDFSHNELPGLKSYEESAYWRDVGTIDAFFEAHQDTLGGEPVVDLFNPDWPIFSSHYQGPVARIVGGEIDNCLFGAASLIHNARLRNTIVRREVVVEEGADLEDCVIMDYVRIGRGAHLRRTVVDRHNLVADGTSIGYDADLDRERFTVSPGGVVVVPKGRSPFHPRGSSRLHTRYAE